MSLTKLHIWTNIFFSTSKYFCLKNRNQQVALIEEEKQHFHGSCVCGKLVDACEPWCTKKELQWFSCLKEETQNFLLATQNNRIDNAENFRDFVLHVTQAKASRSIFHLNCSTNSSYSFYCTFVFLTERVHIYCTAVNLDRYLFCSFAVFYCF